MSFKNLFVSKANSHNLVDHTPPFCKRCTVLNVPFDLEQRKISLCKVIRKYRHSAPRDIDTLFV